MEEIHKKSQEVNDVRSSMGFRTVKENHSF